jgi:hypothetical protein
VGAAGGAVCFETACAQMRCSEGASRMTIATESAIPPLLS